LLKCLHKEIEKTSKLEQRIKQDSENILARQEKAKQMNEKIMENVRKIEELKFVGKAFEKQKNLEKNSEEENDEFSGKNIEDLKLIFIELTNELDQNSKIANKTRRELEIKIFEAEKKLREIKYEKNTFSHQIGKLTRIIQSSRAKPNHVKNSKSQNSLQLDDIKKRLIHKQKYKRMFLKPRMSNSKNVPETADPSIEKSSGPTGSDTFITQENKI